MTESTETVANHQGHRGINTNTQANEHFGENITGGSESNWTIEGPPSLRIILGFSLYISNHPFLRKRAALAFRRRYVRLLGATAAKAFADTFLLGETSTASLCRVAGRQPWLQDVMAESRSDAI